MTFNWSSTNLKFFDSLISHTWKHFGKLKSTRNLSLIMKLFRARHESPRRRYACYQNIQIEQLIKIDSVLNTDGINHKPLLDNFLGSLKTVHKKYYMLWLAGSNDWYFSIHRKSEIKVFSLWFIVTIRIHIVHREREDIRAVGDNQ